MVAKRNLFATKYFRFLTPPKDRLIFLVMRQSTKDGAGLLEMN
jgi:hypothetical protein